MEKDSTVNHQKVSIFTIVPWNEPTQNPHNLLNGIPSFTPCFVLVNGVEALYDADWVVSNSLFSPIRR